MAQDTRKEFDPERVRGPLRRRRWLAAVAFVLPFTVTLTLALSLRDVFQSSATLLIERQQVPESFVKSTILGALETRLQTINQEVLSRSNLETLIARFGLYPDLTMPFAVDRMRRDIQVEMRSVRGGGGGTTVAFAVTYRGIDRTTVAQVASAIAAFYVEENLKVRQRQSTAPAAFLKAPLDVAKTRLEEHDSRLREFNRRHAGQLPQDLAANLTALGRAEMQLRSNRSDHHRALGQRETTRDALIEAETAALREAAEAARKSTSLAERVAEKRAQLAELRTRYSDRYPDVISLTRDLADLERELGNPARETGAPGADARAQATANPNVVRLRLAVTEAEAKLASLQLEEQQLRTEITDYRARVQNRGELDEELKQLTRNVDVARDLHRSLVTRHDEAELSASMEQQRTGEQIRLLDPALPAAEPSAPRRLLLLLIGLVMSLGIAGAAVALVEYLDASFHTVDELQGFTNVRVVATIPWIASGTDALRQRWRRGVAAALVTVFVTSIAVATHVVARQSDVIMVLLAAALVTPVGTAPLLDERLVSLLPSRAADAEPYLTVRHVLEEAQRRAALSIVAVSSSLAGDGRTTTAINVAGALGQGGGRVLLIDADLRNPSVARHLLGTMETPGLVDAIVNPALALPEVITAPPHLAFDVLGAGRSTTTPYDVLRAPRFAALLDEARGRYDYVVLDTPPLLQGADCRVIERSVDGFLVVVAANRTPRKPLAAGLRLLDPVKLVGLVLNADTRPRPWYDRGDGGSGRIGASGGRSMLDRLIDALRRRSA